MEVEKRVIFADNLAEMTAEMNWIYDRLAPYGYTISNGGTTITKVTDSETNGSGKLYKFIYDIDKETGYPIMRGEYPVRFYLTSTNGTYFQAYYNNGNWVKDTTDYKDKSSLGLTTFASNTNNLQVSEDAYVFATEKDINDIFTTS